MFSPVPPPADKARLTRKIDRPDDLRLCGLGFNSNCARPPASIHPFQSCTCWVANNKNELWRGTTTEVGWIVCLSSSFFYCVLIQERSRGPSAAVDARDGDNTSSSLSAAALINGSRGKASGVEHLIPTELLKSNTRNMPLKASHNRCKPKI